MFKGVFYSGIKWLNFIHCHFKIVKKLNNVTIMLLLKRVII